ncbi:ankyrin repeat domain-containing protein [uncultured Sphingomonas sp.]|uniref:ankyrin repeat domain-containing protein n=1 Tax=uncultured Sphingomonas sp. TaxID=158754 RepID=UPI0035CCA1FE
MSPRAFVQAALLLAPAVPAGAQQQSESYKFLQAVKSAKGNDVLAILDRPGANIVNTRDSGNGEGALHIVAKRGDEPYTRYLLQKGADANLRDGRGNTPLLLAVDGGHAGLIPVLIAGRARVDLGNGGGETPLIRAVQRRDVAVTRLLLAAGADPDQTDNVAGMSARDYARRDARNPALAKLLEDAPKRATRAVSGPKL